MRADAAAGVLADRTAQTYARNIRRWLAWLDEAAISVPSPATVLAYVAALRSTGCKPATVNAHLDAVRGLYRWAESRDLYPAIARSVRGLRVHKDEPLDCLTPGEVAALLDDVPRHTMPGMRTRALVHLMFSTGLRLVSVAGLDARDLDYDEQALAYAGKGDRADKSRRAYLSAGACDALLLYLCARGDLPPGAPLFAAHSNNAPGCRLSARGMRKIICALMEAAGHVQRGPDGRLTRPGLLSCHSLRRTAITAAYDHAGLDAAQVLAGHADPGTTRRSYARVKKGRMLRDLAKAMDLDRHTKKTGTRKGKK